MMRHFKVKTLERKAYVKTGALRLVFIVAAISFEIAWLILWINELNEGIPWVSTAIQVVAFIIALLIYGRHENAQMKLMWMIMIMAFPVFGVVIYLLAGLTGTTHAMQKRFTAMDHRLTPFLPDNQALLRELHETDSGAAGQFHYVSQSSGFPLYQNTTVNFHPDPMDALEELETDLRSAKHFIFMEYYAIEDEQVFNEIHEILKKKVEEGVEVRMIYDDIGSIFFINHDFARKMERDGIRCRVFNPMLPLTNIFMHNRDHRKIAVIDGQIGYTGGYNLADEYFHIKEPYGLWKDTGIRLEGDAVQSLTFMFLECWNAIRSKEMEDQDFTKYFPTVQPVPTEQGYIQPYSDTPLSFESVAENVYMNMLANAKDYCWFTTPYLIITDEMIRAFILAAGRGVDVRIITPGIPDKKLVYRVTRSSYRVLARHGIRIFEFTPGFCHAKECVSDDSIAVCGTINLDYRSLYHHFEDACLLYGCDAVTDIKKDIESLFPACTEVTEQYTKNVPFIVRLWETILRMSAPLI